MHYPYSDRSVAAYTDVIEARIVEGLAHCKPIADIAAEIAAQLHPAAPRQPARLR